MRRVGVAGLVVGVVAGVAFGWLVLRPGPPAERPPSAPLAERSVTPPAPAPPPPAARSQESQPPPDLPGFESPPEAAVDPAVLAEAETRVAEYARSQKLINPGQLAQKAERAVPRGSVPSALLGSTREKWMQDALINAAIAKDLTDRKLGPDATTAERNRVMGIAMTLMSIPSEREKQILRMAQQLPD